MKTKLIKRSLLIILSLVSLFSVFASCDKDDPAIVENTDTQNISNNDTISNQMKIEIGSNTFTATLLDNETVRAFKAMLPLTLNMSELNGNEKYYHLSTNLPTNASNPGTIHTGDLMLWGSNSLVLFYQTFSTSYSYTKLGRIDDVSGLAASVGSGSATITFELE